jgi:hypothetical protein
MELMRGIITTVLCGSLFFYHKKNRQVKGWLGAETRGSMVLKKIKEWVLKKNTN